MKPERILDLALLALALALPLSIAGTEISLGIAVLAWLATRPWTRPQAPWVRPLAWASLALLGAWLLASATSATPVASLVKARQLWTMILVFVLADRLRDVPRARRFVTLMLGAGALTSAIGFVGFAIRHGRGEFDQPLQGVFSTAVTTGNVLATLVLAATALVLFARGGERRTWFDRGACAVLVASLMLTFRRGSYLGWLAGTVVLIALRKARLLLIVPVLVAVALVLMPEVGRQRAMSIAHPTDWTSLGRLSLWKSGYAAFKDRPWTGWGLQDGMPLIERYKRADARFPAGHFHDNWVQIAVTTGVVGLLAYGAWMALAGLGAWRAFRRTRSAFAVAGFAAWVGFQVAGIFDWSFGDAEVANQLFAWLGIALAAGGTAALTASSASGSFTSAAHPPAGARLDGEGPPVPLAPPDPEIRTT
jgi:O-antigen ligase